MHFEGFYKNIYVLIWNHKLKVSGKKSHQHQLYNFASIIEIMISLFQVGKNLNRKSEFKFQM